MKPLQLRVAVPQKSTKCTSASTGYHVKMLKLQPFLYGCSKVTGQIRLNMRIGFNTWLKMFSSQ